MPLSMMEEGSLVPTWTMLMKYPKLIPNMNGEIRDILNTLQELIPIKFRRSRLDTFLMWWSCARALGLVTFQEDMKVKHEMIHGAGGM